MFFLHKKSSIVASDYVHQIQCWIRSAQPDLCVRQPYCFFVRVSLFPLDESTMSTFLSHFFLFESTLARGSRSHSYSRSCNTVYCSCNQITPFRWWCLSRSRIPVYVGVDIKSPQSTTSNMSTHSTQSNHSTISTDSTGYGWTCAFTYVTRLPFLSHTRFLSSRTLFARLVSSLFASIVMQLLAFDISTKTPIRN